MACRHCHGTTGSRRLATRHTPHRRPRWTARVRWPARIVGDVPAAPPAAGQATASAAFLPGPQPNLVAAPCTHLQSTHLQTEVLRRPVESTLGPVVAMDHRLI